MQPNFEHIVKLGICTPIPAIDGPAGKRLAPVTVEWHRARQALIMPFGWNGREIAVDGMEVGEARCEAVRAALRNGLEYLFFLDWDVLLPPRALHRLMQKMQNNPELDVLAGVYFVKMDPPAPLIYRGWGCGPFWDWTPGDLLVDGITGCGMGCTLIRTSLFTRLSHSEEVPWFKTRRELEHREDGDNAVYVTEDLWFCKRAVEEARAKIGIDTGIVCAHIDPATGIEYIMPEDSLPARRLKAKMAEEAECA